MMGRGREHKCACKTRSQLSLAADRVWGSSEAVGNGRAVATLFAREGAKVLVVDRDLASAEETVALISEAGFQSLQVARRN